MQPPQDRSDRLPLADPPLHRSQRCVFVAPDRVLTTAAELEARSFDALDAWSELQTKT